MEIISSAYFRQQKKSITLLIALQKEVANDPGLQVICTQLTQKTEPTYKDLIHAARKALRIAAKYNSSLSKQLKQWTSDLTNSLRPKVSSHLYSESNYRIKKHCCCRSTIQRRK